MKLLLIGALVLSTSAFANYSTTTKKTSTTTSPTASAETTDVTGATDSAIKTQEERMEDAKSSTEQRMEDSSGDLEDTTIKRTEKEVESIDTTPAPSSTPSTTPSTTAP